MADTTDVAKNYSEPIIGHDENGDKENPSGGIDKVTTLHNCYFPLIYQFVTRWFDSAMAQVDIGGLISILVFYVLIALVGVAAAWWRDRRGAKRGGGRAEAAIVAGRDIGAFVGIFTMIATWVGGGYINGTAEQVYNLGVIHAQAPIGYAVSLLLGGLLFAVPMRRRRYMTMIDPFDEKYGSVVAALMYIPALTGELLWSAAILNALGTSVSIILSMDFEWAVIVSAAVAVLYTFVGGLYSVAFTDVVQLVCIAVGLTVAIPFAWSNEHVDWSGAVADSQGRTWHGELDTDKLGSYIDSFLLVMFGGIPWQVYFQRVLSSRSTRQAQWLSFCAAIGCLVMAVPPILIGVVAQNTDWPNATRASTRPVNLTASSQFVLPYVVHQLTPPVVGYIGLGAVSAAVMSSSDSSILSASSMFAHNIVRPLVEICVRKAPDQLLVWTLRCSVLVWGALACLIAISVPKVYDLWYLCSDLVYVILFPQLLCVIYVPFTNAIGSFTGFLVGLVIRCIAGEPAIGWPSQWDYGTQFPYKTVAMLVTLAAILLASALARLTLPPRVWSARWGAGQRDEPTEGANGEEQPSGVGSHKMRPLPAAVDRVRDASNATGGAQKRSKMKTMWLGPEDEDERAEHDGATAADETKAQYSTDV